MSLPMYHRKPNRSNGDSGSENNNMRNNRYDVESGRKVGGKMTANDTNANILEQQNNERINDLSAQVARLKGLSIDIGNEVREQNSLLDNMGDGFQNTRDMLIGSLGRIGTMLESGGAKHMCYMVGFCVFVMIFLWWLMSYKSTNGA